MKNKQPEDDLLALIALMRAEIGTLTGRVSQLEHGLDERASAGRAEIGEETLLAISAAIAAFLGVPARIRQVRVVHSRVWAQVGRIGVHASHRLN